MSYTFLSKKGGLISSLKYTRVFLGTWFCCCTILQWDIEPKVQGYVYIWASIYKIDLVQFYMCKWEKIHKKLKFVYPILVSEHRWSIFRIIRFTSTNPYTVDECFSTLVPQGTLPCMFPPASAHMISIDG